MAKHGQAPSEGIETNSGRIVSGGAASSARVLDGVETGPSTINEKSATAKPGTTPAGRRAIRRAAATGEALSEQVYAFHDLSDYSFRDRLKIHGADLILYCLIKVICSTLRWEVRGGEHLDSILAGGHRAIFTFWHTCIFTATWLWRGRGIVVMSSRSRDGEFTGRLIKRFGYGTARGSSTRGAGRALAEMAACLEIGKDVAFTIDGPRGPAYLAKGGAVTLARHTAHAILPFHIATSRSMQLPSWDRLQIPLPFARALAVVGEPIYVSRAADAAEVQSKQAALQQALDRARKEAEDWRGKPHRTTDSRHP